MLFNSLEFLIFFPTVTLLYFVIPQRVRYLWLLGASYYFYMCWNPQYALLMATSTVITYASGIFISHGKTPFARKLCVGISFVLNLAILFYFKYYTFTLENINAVRKMLHMSMLLPRFDVILPVGISFYTFQALSYTVDVYRGDVKPEKNPLRYALFVSFFPQLVAGPIERSKNLLSQLNERHSFDYERMRSGFLLMLWGYFQKLVIADRAAIFVDTVYNNTAAFGGAMPALATVLFAVQIYCDFASYSLIAKGAARVMGFELMDNFKTPYLSTSIAEFWRRWHISLSGWFRDYLYIPMGGNRKGTFRKYFNIMVVFLASGLWHGASWHFVIWGLLHGFYRIIGAVTQKLRENLCRALKINRETGHFVWFSRACTFLLVCFAWIFFRSSDMAQSGEVIRKIFTDFRPWELFGGISVAGLGEGSGIVLALATAVLAAVSSKGGTLCENVEKSHLILRWTVYLLLIFAVLIFGIYGGEYSASQFIYFQF